MKPEIKDLWADFLEAEVLPILPASLQWALLGQVDPVHGNAKLEGPHYSLLGTLTELYRRETGIGEWTVQSSPGAPKYLRYDIPNRVGGAQFLPYDVADWAGVSFDPRIYSDNGRKPLRLLDLCSSTFSTLDAAKLLRKTPAECIH